MMHCMQRFSKTLEHANACWNFQHAALHLILAANTFQSLSVTTSGALLWWFETRQSSMISPSHSSQNQQLQPFSQLQPSRQIQWSGPSSCMISSNVLFRRLGSTTVDSAWSQWKTAPCFATSVSTAADWAESGLSKAVEGGWRSIEQAGPRACTLGTFWPLWKIMSSLQLVSSPPQSMCGCSWISPSWLEAALPLVGCNDIFADRNQVQYIDAVKKCEFLHAICTPNHGCCRWWCALNFEYTNAN